MRKGDVQNVGAVISDLIKEYRIGGKYEEAQLCAAWKQMMGPTISNYTTEMFLKRKCFYVKLKSSVLREELMLGKGKIVTGLNEMLGQELINEVKFI